MRQAAHKSRDRADLSEVIRLILVVNAAWEEGPEQAFALAIPADA